MKVVFNNTKVEKRHKDPKNRQQKVFWLIYSHKYFEKVYFMTLK